MQSQDSSKQQPRIPLPLPWGFGSMAFKGAVWWLTWRDENNQVHYDNSGTADAAEAQRIMAQKALPRAQAMLAQLERIANGEETYQGKGAARRTAAKRRAARADSGAPVPNRRRGRPKKESRGGRA